jgi:hypothetical protein
MLRSSIRRTTSAKRTALKTPLHALLALSVLITANAHADAPTTCPDRLAVDDKVRATLIRHLQPRLDEPPHAMAHTHTEGLLPHQGIHDASAKAREDLPLMQDAALAWRAGAGDAYRIMAARYLDAWVTTYQPSYDPIDETGFDALIDTYVVLRATLPADQRTRTENFLRQWGQGYVQRMDAARGARQGTWTNNWQSHRVKLVTLIAVALNDPAMFDAARRLFRAQVSANIHPDGEVIDFEERDALHYVAYDLEPLLRAALAARTRGEDWYHYATPDGASLAKAVQWLKPYADGEQRHQEFVHSSVAFDRKRADAGLSGFSGWFDPTHADAVYWYASVFEPDYRPLAKQLKASPPASLYVCGD